MLELMQAVGLVVIVILAMLTMLWLLDILLESVIFCTVLVVFLCSCVGVFIYSLL